MRTTLKWLGIVVAILAIIATLPHPALAAHTLHHATMLPDTLLVGFAGMIQLAGDRASIDAQIRAMGRRLHRDQRNGARRRLDPRHGFMKFPTRASSYQALFNNANVTNATVPEAIPWIYYDTQNLATGGTSAAYFAATNADTSLCNIEQPNTIAGEKYFMIYAITFDFLMGNSVANNSSAATQFDDAHQIMETAHAALSLILADKLIFRIPLAACHAIGGYQAWIAGSNFSGSGIFNSVQNMASDGAWWADGAIILPPRQSFQFAINTNTAWTLTATRACRLSLHGVLYRPVR